MKDQAPNKEDQNKKNRRKGEYREDSASRDDTVGHFHADKGTFIADRFKVIRQVGLGTFGKVLECLDTKRSDPPMNPEMALHGGEMAFVAIKMVRKIKRYREAAMVEARIIQSINRKGGRGLSHCVRLRDAFDFSGHYCLVFESLGPSLHDFLKKNRFRGFPMVCVQDFAVQLLEALDFLHAMNIIHTDLKIGKVCLLELRAWLIPTHSQFQRISCSWVIEQLIIRGKMCQSLHASNLLTSEALATTTKRRAPSSTHGSIVHLK